MSSTIFCCGQITPYRPQHLSHESKFTSFLAWAAFPRKSSVGNVPVSGDIAAPFAIQLVRQVNFGPLESKRYFIPCTDAVAVFDEVNEDALIQANFQKLNTCVHPTWLCCPDLMTKYQVQELQVRQSQQIFRAQCVPEGPNQQASLASELGEASTRNRPGAPGRARPA